MKIIFIIIVLKVSGPTGSYSPRKVVMSLILSFSRDPNNLICRQDARANAVH